jgi:predicted metal-dependent phosphoesterase TrpH
MNELGFNLDLDELIRKVGRGSAGRPHLARMLIEKGIVKDIPEAFNKYLSKGRPVHVPKMKLSAQQAFNLIHKAGGIAILAHPFSLGYQNYVNLGREILNLKKIGLDGLEAYYTNHDIYLTKWLINFAQENDLLISGGSDFHGKPRPDIEIGKGLGNLNIPYHIYENLKLYISD